MTKYTFSTTLILFALLLGSHVKAQSPTSIGLRTGVNFASISGDAFNNYKGRTGLNFGAFLTHSIVSHFGITGEINYAQKGARLNENNEWNVNYLEIPVYGSYFFGKDGSNIRPKIFAGPYLGVLMNSKSKVNGVEVNTADSFNSVDFGALFGAGAHFRIGDGVWLYVDGRYGLGLADATKSSIRASNRVPSINLGISFSLD
jgi:outer membrane protein W